MTIAVLKYSASDNRYRRRQLLASTDRYLVRWSRSAPDHNAFGGKLSGELDGLVSSLRSDLPEADFLGR